VVHQPINQPIHLPGGSTITNRGGKVSDIHDAKRGMDVHHGLGGGRIVSHDLPGHGRIVSEQGRRGYVQRGYAFHGHDFGRRSYYYNGRPYDRFYRGYGYRGMYLNVYAPGYYYRPGFYGWAYNPWAAPIAFGWGWGGNPWYGYYGGYFQPYPVYPSAAFWLTDYIISQDLQAAYAARQAGENDGTPVAAAGPPVLTPEVKDMIANEVKNQLARENSEAAQNAQGQDADPSSSSINRLLSDGHPHVFVAGGNLDATDASGAECVVSDGDALQLRIAPPSDATTANLVVLSSKGRPECPINSTVQVQLTDLQEMENHMRENIDQGLQDLQAKQGTGGLPAAPPSAQGQPVLAAYAADAPPPDPNVGAEIRQQDQQGDQAQKDVTAEAAQGSGGAASAAPAAPDATAAPAAPAAPASVEMGQTPDQVQAALGAPTSIAKLGPKVIYYYNGMKVTFKDGKVSDVFAQTASSQQPARFTIQHMLHFVTGTEAERKQLTEADPNLKEYLDGKFVIAREDLSDDGVKEVILMFTDEMWCGTGAHGCPTMVLEKKGATFAVLLDNQSIPYGTLAVTNEKIGKYRALAVSDGKGGILLGDKEGTPMFGKQLVYGMRS
jgi:hypothetical protein